MTELDEALSQGRDCINCYQVKAQVKHLLLSKAADLASEDPENAIVLLIDWVEGL